ncbi:hypothetical protein DSC_01755 [Pseudoxanthomonas spadix BD-a59]|jgi:uncharacterized membrane protein|uniref:Transmembrane protein n=1 Tax=Pseudoxanthomonas spadix (strain BD-a59) TaxID=1045855 RepID=G7UUB5_PSEUP|nr:hypothetical protein [Pseudoxanthomonas spadix]AER55004.1 hypothetical protein DSC_01755 [Pseudoxanthomonas spadix BD-a59]
MYLKDSKLWVAVAAALAGYLNVRLVETFWVFWLPINPIADMLFGHRPVSPYYGWVLYPTDALASVLVSLPLGVFIAWLGTRHYRWAVAFATLPYLSSVYWFGLLEIVPTARLEAAAIAVISVVVTPLACWSGRLLLNRFTPNTSSKPNPRHQSP